MFESDNPRLKKINNPILIAIGFYLLAVILIGIVAALNAMGAIEVIPHYPWLITAILTLLFSVYGVGLLVYNQNLGRSIQLTTYSFVGLVVLGSLTAWFTSGLSIREAGAIRLVYLLLVIGYIAMLFLSIGYKSTLRFIEDRDNMKLAREREMDKHSEE